MRVVGLYRHTLDVKSRVAVPAQFREKLGETFYVMKGPDTCLFVYDQEGFDAITMQFAEYSSTYDDRNMQRLRFAGAFSPELDKQGRFVIPQDLVEYANLKKDLVIFGMNNRIEIWDADEWNKTMEIAQATETEAERFEAEQAKLVPQPPRKPVRFKW